MILAFSVTRYGFVKSVGETVITGSSPELSSAVGIVIFSKVGISVSSTS